MNTITFMGVKIHPLTMTKTLESIDFIINCGKFWKHSVINVSKIVNMKKNRTFFNDVNNADLINADGMGIVWGARFLGLNIPERVTGIDLFINLLKLSEIRGYKVYFLGARQELLEKMIQNIKKKYPRLIISGYNNGYFNVSEEKKISLQIKKTGAQILFVGISSPKKEHFINSQFNNTDVSFAMGVGGSFDILAGLTKRAPLFIQKSGFEWLYRLSQEPKRMFKRYLITNCLFLFMLIKEFIKLKINQQ